MFPAASVAVHVTTVFPIGKIPPVGALLVNVTPVQLSAAVGAVNTTVAVHPAPAVAVIATGVVNVGAVTSITVTIWVLVELFPLASVAVHVTVVFPIGKIPPVGALLVNVMLFGAVQLSATAGAVKTIVAVQVAPALAVTVAGAVITGAIASVTVTVCVLVELFPLASVAVQVTVVTPTGNKPLAGALLVNVTGLVQLSVAVGAVNTTTALQLAPAVAVIATGVLITGAVVSVTVNVVAAETAEQPEALITVT